MATKFDFASPGIKINEIDLTALPNLPVQKGPVIIGRFEKGPDNLPTVVQSLADFERIFGRVITGVVDMDKADVWRRGNITSPQYAGFATKVALANNIPVTVIRVVGMQSQDQTSGVQTGYKLANYNRTTSTFQGAMGLFVINSASLGDANPRATGSLAAVFYLDSGSVELSGTRADDTEGTGSCTFIKSTNTGTSTKPAFDLMIRDGSGNLVINSKITFDNNSGEEMTFIRDLNTNPVNTNTTLYATDSDQYDNYWVGETYEHDVPRGVCWGVTLPLEGAATSYADLEGKGATAAASGFVIAADTNSTGSGDFAFNPERAANAERLFKFHAVSRDLTQGRIHVAIEDLSVSQNQVSNPYASFDVVVYSNKSGRELERFANCNLNPSDNQYIAKMIGTRYVTWDESNRRFVINGKYVNRSGYIRVEMAATNLTPTALPFGYLGPDRYKGFEVYANDPVAASASIHILTGSGGQSAGDDSAAGEGFSAGSTLTISSSTDAGVAIRLFITGSPTQTTNLDSGGPIAPLQGGFLTGGVGSLLTIDQIGDLLARTIGLATGSNLTASYDSSTNYVTVKTYEDATSPNLWTLSVSSSFSGSEDSAPLNVWAVTASTGGATNAGLANAATGTLNGGAGQTSGTFQGIEGTTYSTVGTGSTSTVFGPNQSAIMMSQAKTASFTYPTVRLVERPPLDSTAIGAGTAQTLFGMQVFESSSDGGGNKMEFDRSLLDGLRAKGTSVSGLTETSHYFTLDDLVEGDNTLLYQSGSRNGQSSFTYNSGSRNLVKKVKGFRVPLWGGFDGFDVQESDPLSNTVVNGAKTSTNYAFFSLAKAIDMAGDKNFTPGSMVVMPGVREENLTKRLLDRATERGDLLAIVDLDAGQTMNTETVATSVNEYGSVNTLLTNKRNRRLDTSYGCAFFPDIDAVVDGGDGVSSALVLPSSIAGLGALSYTENVKKLWFAPAGFNRGGLAAALRGTKGSSGVVPEALGHYLTQRESDDLYTTNVNPIKNFNNAFVVFGQKTFQVKRSALDRINVRRLSIFIKDFLNETSKGFLFEQNVPATWDRFKSIVTPKLQDIKAGLGITDFKLILDNTTTTPELIDRNVMYVKLLVKPARAIEYIVIDFTLTNTGVEF
jgi:hypothetical protein